MKLIPSYVAFIAAFTALQSDLCSAERCDPGDIFVAPENLCFTPILPLVVTFMEARDICNSKDRKMFIPNPDIGGGATARNLLQAGVFPTNNPDELGEKYIGLWTNVLYRTRLDQFWDPIGKEFVDLTNAFIGNEVVMGTNYGMILKWNNDFENRKYRTFDLEAEALFTCAYPPDLSTTGPTTTVETTTPVKSTTIIDTTTPVKSTTIIDTTTPVDTTTTVETTTSAETTTSDETTTSAETTTPTETTTTYPGMKL